MQKQHLHKQRKLSKEENKKYKGLTRAPVEELEKQGKMWEDQKGQRTNQKRKEWKH